MTIEASDSRELDLRPHGVLEAGGETVAILLAAMARSIDEMLPGQVLEIVSHEPAAIEAISRWCRETGHELLDSLRDGEEGQFWIRKQ